MCDVCVRCVVVDYARKQKSDVVGAKRKEGGTDVFNVQKYKSVSTPLQAKEKRVYNFLCIACIPKYVGTLNKLCEWNEFCGAML